jgi:hypothetical protein
MGTSTATGGRGCSKGRFSAFHETARETIGWMITTSAFRWIGHLTVAYFLGLAFSFGAGTS